MQCTEICEVKMQNDIAAVLHFIIICCHDKKAHHHSWKFDANNATEETVCSKQTKNNFDWAQAAAEQNIAG